MELNELEMTKVNGGGGISVTVVSVIGGIITFILGTISGYTNPTRCNN